MKIILSAILPAILLTTGCAQQSTSIFNGEDLSNWQFIIEENAVPERPAFPVIPKKGPSSEQPVGDWNKVSITVNDGAISIQVNDLLQNSATSEVKEGHIGLQSEGKAIQFRNLVLQPLKDSEQP